MEGIERSSRSAVILMINLLLAIASPDRITLRGGYYQTASSGEAVRATSRLHPGELRQDCHSWLQERR